MRRLASLIIGLAAGSLFILLLYLILRPKGRKSVRLLIQSVQEDVGMVPEIPAENDNLEAIIGIGPAYARKLNEAGIQTYAGLAKTSPDRITEIIGPRARPSDVDSWIAQANGLS
jgi:predicted flap endonuclease-1-like 5' DNA nuclease